MNPLEKKILGSSGIEVTRLGLGCSSLGSLQGDDADNLAAQIVHQALDLGLNLFDTAPLYGRGSSEERLGKALHFRAPRGITTCWPPRSGAWSRYRAAGAV